MPARPLRVETTPLPRVEFRDGSLKYVGSSVARFTPSRRYLMMGIAAVCGTALSVWSALRWDPFRPDAWSLAPLFSPLHLNFNLSWLAAVLFAIPAVALLALAFRPAIEIHSSYLRIGKQEIPWARIRRLDQSGWNVPLLVYLTLDDDRRITLLHPGDADSSGSLLRHLRRSAREALLDGVPYRQFWGEPPAAAAPPRIAPVRYPLLRPEDEDEVERMFQRLKSAGHLEQQRRDADPE
jgi:hypothetical protein